MAPRIEGLVAAPVTPLLADGSVNLDRIDEQAALFERNGVTGVFVCGTTGESMSLTVPERHEIARRWVAAADRLTVIVHVGHTSLRAAQELATEAARIGARGIGAMGPCFFRPETVEDLASFSGAIASAAPELPFYYYHIPSLTGIALPMHRFLEVADGRIPTLAGIKYTDDDLMDFERCLRYAGGQYDLLFGRDEMLLSSLVLGTRGAVGSTYNFAAPLFLRLIAAFDAGDLATARTLQHLAVRTIDAMNRSGGSFMAATKAVLRMVGLDCGTVRPPLRDLTPEQHVHLETGLREIGLFEHTMR